MLSEMRSAKLLPECRGLLLREASNQMRQRSPWFEIWDFPKIRGTLSWGPCSKDPTILGAMLGSPIFGNSHLDGLSASLYI